MMDKAYPSRINWENLPSRRTPINQTNLNKGDSALRTIDDRVITLDTVKADKTTAAGHVKDVTLNQTNGVLTITWENGATRTYDTALEKIAVNFDVDPDTLELILYDKDGQELLRVDLSELMVTDDFIDNNVFDWTVTTETIIDPQDPTKKHTVQHVNLKLKDYSIQDRYMQPHYLADITTQRQLAEDAAESAEDSADEADYYRMLSQSYAVGGTGQRANENVDNSKYYSQQSAAQATNSANSASASATSATNSANSASQSLASKRLSEAYATGEIEGTDVPSDHEAYQNNSKYYAQLSDNSAQASNQSAISSAQSATNSQASAVASAGSASQSHDYEVMAGQEANRAETARNASQTYATNSANSAVQSLAYSNDSKDWSDMSKSYAVGTNGETRTGDGTDNSKYYSEVAAGHAATADAILDDVREAGEEAVQAIEDALDQDAPSFYIDFTTGELMYDGGRFVFSIDYTTGNLMWGLAV